MEAHTSSGDRSKGQTVDCCLSHKSLLQQKLKKINISAKVCLQSNLIFYIIFQYCHVHKCTFPHSTLMQDDFFIAIIDNKLFPNNNLYF